MKRDCVREIIVESTRGWWLICTVVVSSFRTEAKWWQIATVRVQWVSREFVRFDMIHPTTLHMLRIPWALSHFENKRNRHLLSCPDPNKEVKKNKSQKKLSTLLNMFQFSNQCGLWLIRQAATWAVAAQPHPNTHAVMPMQTATQGLLWIPFPWPRVQWQYCCFQASPPPSWSEL